MMFHFSYAGITRIRFMGYILSLFVKAPPTEKNVAAKLINSIISRVIKSNVTVSPFHDLLL